MKKNKVVALAAFAIMTVAAMGYAQEQGANSVSIAFSDPSKPGLLKANLTYGGIVVRGYDGDDVIVESMPRGTQDEEGRRKKSKGMWVIPNTSMGFTIEEEDNVMKIRGHGNSRMDLVIEVPVNTSLRLSCVNGGDVVVENVRGEIEANNTNGGIRIADVSGTVVANTTNGSVVVSFDEITPDKAMSFVSFNGRVDVTFPEDVKANVKLKTENGSIYSDFEIDIKRTIRKIEENERERGGKYKVRLEGTMYGELNGGGPEMHFSTYNGSIYIRKR